MCYYLSIYNLLKCAGYSGDFTQFTQELVHGDCLKEGSVDWIQFNKLQTGFKYRWMQDKERKCEAVNPDNLKYWVNSDRQALIKVQSQYAPWRRHFMSVLRFDNGIADCLEPSDRSGILKLRPINEQDILGVRYIRKTLSDIEETNDDLSKSPFAKTDMPELT